jgi:hypothetical protein
MTSNNLCEKSIELSAWKLLLRNMSKLKEKVKSGRKHE